MKSNSEKEYEVIRLNENNIDDLEKLYTAVYKKKVTPSYFRKKYNTGYTGILYIGYLAYKNEIPIAFYGVIPCFIEYERRTILSAQSADTMTHPEHRYKNLFLELAKMCFELCKQNNIKLVFGFPNQNSYRGFLKLGFQVTETMSCFAIKIHQNLFKRILNKINKKKSISVLKNCSIHKNGVENSAIKDGFAGVFRDEKYLQYKTYNQTTVIKIARSEIWISIKNFMLIGDIIIQNTDFDNLIESIKELAKKIGISIIYFHACNGTSLYKLFMERFEAVPSFPVIFKNFDEHIKIENIKFTFADIDTF